MNSGLSIVVYNIIVLRTLFHKIDVLELRSHSF